MNNSHVSEFSPKSQYLPVPSLKASFATQSAMVHHATGFSQRKLIELIIDIYNGSLPQSYQVLRCQHGTTQEEIQLFMSKASMHHLEYTVLGVNNLPLQVQEVILVPERAM